jgi:hypothetical protein
VEEPRYGTVVGLALYAAQRMAQGLGGSAGAGQRGRRGSGAAMGPIVDRVKTWLQEFF